MAMAKDLEMTEFSYYLGYLIGLLTRADVKDELSMRGVSSDELMKQLKEVAEKAVYDS